MRKKCTLGKYMKNGYGMLVKGFQNQTLVEDEKMFFFNLKMEASYISKKKRVCKLHPRFSFISCSFSRWRLFSARLSFPEGGCESMSLWVYEPRKPGRAGAGRASWACFQKLAGTQRLGLEVLLCNLSSTCFISYIYMPGSDLCNCC